jgi:iron-sulfur cluster repair protein YtfE (RIC family)
MSTTVQQDVSPRIAKPTLRTVTDHLEADHRRLDAIVAEIDRLLDNRAIDEAGRWLAELTRGLDWHIRAEEKVLFPLVEKSGGGLDGPTTVMRGEHVEIRRLLKTAAEEIGQGKARLATQTIELLGMVLKSHNGKEERVLYPLADQLAGGDAEREALVTRLQDS